MRDGGGPEIHPELMEASPVYRSLIDSANDLMSIGIDPALAAMVVAAVPVTLRVLKMGNEFTSAMVDDWKDNKRIERKRRELELNKEFGLNGANEP